jgi:hypothetical protein
VDVCLCCVFVVAPEAETQYKAALAKFGDVPAQAFVDRAQLCIASCQLTSFESHLVRSLKKEAAEDQLVSVQKYMGIYATVPSGTFGFAARLHAEAQRIMAEASKSKPLASSSSGAKKTGKKT